MLRSHTKTNSVVPNKSCGVSRVSCRTSFLSGDRWHSEVLQPVLLRQRLHCRLLLSKLPRPDWSTKTRENVIRTVSPAAWPVTPGEQLSRGGTWSPTQNATGRGCGQGHREAVQNDGCWELRHLAGNHRQARRSETGNETAKKKKDFMMGGLIVPRSNIQLKHELLQFHFKIAANKTQRKVSPLPPGTCGKSVCNVRHQKSSMKILKVGVHNKSLFSFWNVEMLQKEEETNPAYLM